MVNRPTNRRAFIKSSCSLCAGAIGLAVLGSALSGCTAATIYKATAVDGSITVPLTVFKENKTVIVRTAKLEYDILLIKKDTGGYTALYMMCTHNDNPLTATNKNLVCPSHGSVFDFEGNVLQSPASKTLRRFTTSSSEQAISIKLS